MILMLTVQPGQRLIDGTRQLGLKPPRASAVTVASVDNVSSAENQMMREVRGMEGFGFFCWRQPGMLAVKRDCGELNSIQENSRTFVSQNFNRTI
jgi:hypothetical protein